MSKGRKALEPTEIVEPDLDQDRIGNATQHMRALAQSAESQKEFDLCGLFRLIGQYQAHRTSTQISRTLEVCTLVQIKEEKQYQSLKGMRFPDGSGFSGTWEGFCQLIGRSVAIVDEDITNFKTFGEEALDSMKALGLSYRDLRKLRKLPEDEQVALIEAAKEGDKDALMDLAESLIARQAKEKAALEKRAIEAEREAKLNKAALTESSAEVATLKASLTGNEFKDQIAQLQAELEGIKTKRIRVEWQDQFRGLFEDVGEIYAAIGECFDKLESINKSGISDEPETPEDEEDLNRVRRTLAGLVAGTLNYTLARHDKFTGFFEKTLGAHYDGEGQFQ